MATAPKAKGKGYNFPITKQAMYANRQFKVVTTQPSQIGQVQFHNMETDNSIALIATCWDGGTCNKLAAMYKAVVKSSRPQLFCGAMPLKGSKVPSALFPPDNWWLPPPGPSNQDNATERCWRINACIMSNNPNEPSDPGLECQRAPGKFKLDCAQKEPCSAVLSCMGR